MRRTAGSNLIFFECIAIVACCVSGCMQHAEQMDPTLGDTDSLRAQIENKDPQGRAVIEPWQDRLPVSMNGELSANLPEDFENIYWHSLRQKPQYGGGRGLGRFIGSNLFSDPKLNELKDCILRVDVAGMKKLLDDGVDIDATGKGSITLLFIAFFVDTDPRPFELLLERGANPNVLSWYDLAPPLGNFSGMSVAHLASIPTYNRLFQKVFDGDADPNQLEGLFQNQAPPFVKAVYDSPDYWERLNLMVKGGADFGLLYERPKKSFLSEQLNTFVRAEDDSQRERSCRMILLAIENNAEFEQTFQIPKDIGTRELRWGGCYFTPIHFFAQASLEQGVDLDHSDSPNVKKLIKLLEGKTLSLEDAIVDLKRWEQWKSEGLGELIEIEHQKRTADETGAALKQWLESGVQLSIEAIRSKH